MRIYFSGIAEEKNFCTDNRNYNAQIVSALRRLRHEVIVDCSETDSLFFDERNFARRLGRCEYLVVEATGASSRLGHQMSYGEYRKIPEYGFYHKAQERKVSLMFLQNPYPHKIPYIDERDIHNLIRALFPKKMAQSKAVQQKLFENESGLPRPK